MILYPAIDLIDGQCVRLVQGDFAQKKIYPMDALKLAKKYAEQGAEYLHVIDLDGAKQQQPMQTNLIVNMFQETHLKIQVGGGIRSEKDIATLLESGMARVIVGSLAVTQPQQVGEWIRNFGAERIVLALDIRIKNNQPFLAEQGWSVLNKQSLWQLLDFCQNYSAKHVLCTDIDLDGTLKGPNIDLYTLCQKRYPTLCFQASGGIANIADLHQLKKIQTAGAIIGKALLEERFSFSAALKKLNDEAQLC